jgi:prophage DNA circulation protein
MATIRDLASIAPWRRRWQPANFDGIPFHVETGSYESGRRIVTHEFPKKDLPYSEDMGRKAIEFSVRGYCIQFVTDSNRLYQRDYTIPREDLKERLQTGAPGVLQLPFMVPVTVVCSRFRMTEEERIGGYVAFDMTFVELGTPPFVPMVDSRQQLIEQSQNLRGQILQSLQTVS